MGVDGEPAVGSARLPSIVYAAYQGMFAVGYPICLMQTLTDM